MIKFYLRGTDLEDLLSSDSFADGSMVEIQTSFAQVTTGSQERLESTGYQSPLCSRNKLLFLLVTHIGLVFFLFTPEDIQKGGT